MRAEDTIIDTPDALEHDLTRHFPSLLRFESTAELKRSDAYAAVESEAERLLRTVVTESFSRPAPEAHRHITAAAWNIERGSRLDGIIDALRDHDGLRGRDLYLLTELDYGMARSGNRFVAREIAEELGLNYAFAPIYIALQKGSGVESDVPGENTHSIHGLGIFSQWPIRRISAVPLPNGKDKMLGKEKRLGWLRALVAEIEHPAATFRAVCVHLDVHCSREHRRMQMQLILDHVDSLPPMPTVIGGDWNTTTFNAQSAQHAILGYWRRVMMGIRNVATNHFPYPDRYFERRLFAELERRGYEYKALNAPGVGTLHYHVESIEKNTNLRDWVPEWCFSFIFWAAAKVGGAVSVKLDWFAARGMHLAAGSQPATVPHLHGRDGEPLSDHDPITVELDVSATPDM